MTAFPWADFAWSLPVTGAAVVVTLAVAFIVAVRTGRHAVVDIAWGIGFVAVAASSAIASAAVGDPYRRLLTLALVTIWGLRLAGHIARRSRGRGEDPRYHDLLSRAPGNRNWYALRTVYLAQGLLMWFVSLPVQVTMFQPGPVTPWVLVGVALWALGVMFESVGDAQLTRFRSDPANEGTILQTGLWRYTRHPNYFGDACVWWGISLVAFVQWPGILTILSPAVMTYLLVNGSGKPLLERHMADHRQAYRDYAARTSSFVPWPPRP